MVTPAAQDPTDPWREPANDARLAYPIPESLTIHPADRGELNRQLPTATVYGQPIHGNTPIIQNARADTPW